MPNINIHALMTEIIKIRDLIDKIETKGHDNYARLSIAYEHCTELVEQLNKAYEEAMKAHVPDLKEVSTDETDEVT